MLSTTQGIILRMVKYSDKASAVTVFTRDHGRVVFVAYGVSGKKSGGKAALLQPLSLVELTLYMQPGKEMHQLKDIRSDVSLPGISGHPVKNAIALFLSELLFKSLRHQQEEHQLFDFLHKSFEWLNESTEGIANFHLVLMCKLTRYLGCEPNMDSAGAAWFDLLNGNFSFSQPLHSHCIRPELTPSFTALLRCGFSTMNTLNISREQRIELLDMLIEYYKLHLPEFHPMQSTAVLHELFS